jgi:hypothetical protein
MRFEWNELGRIFPITDVPTARLMKIKARALRFAGAITEEQWAEVNRRANAVILRKFGLRSPKRRTLTKLVCAT